MIIIMLPSEAFDDNDYSRFELGLIQSLLMFLTTSTKATFIPNIKHFCFISTSFQLTCIGATNNVEMKTKKFI